MNLLRVLCMAIIVMGSVSAYAEQATLEKLYRELKTSKTQSEADETVGQIWLEWFKSGDSVVDRMMTEAMNEIEQKRLKSALAILNQVVEEAPDFPEGWNSRATVLFLLGAFDSSIHDIGRTLALEPRHFGAMAGLGKILIHKGRLQQALDIYRRALAVNPFMVERETVVPALERELQQRGI